MATTIEWTDTVWNPVRGCSLVSAGCANCYAMKQAHRFSGKGKPYEGLTELGPQGPRWTGKVRLVPDVLEAPLHWRQPRRVFVNSMSDLFHEDVPDEFIDRVWGIMSLAPRHTYQILTKRPERMLAVVSKLVARHACRDGSDWPLPNVWLGVSVENQQTADERIPLLLQTPAAVRFVSAEPLLGAIDLCRYCAPNFPCDWPGLDWVIVGGESGPKARPCYMAWILSIKDQCQAAGVPVFIKQLGSQPRGWCAAIPHGDEPESSYERDYCDLYEASEIPEPCSGRCGCLVDRKGGDMAEWPADLRVREFPC